MTALITTYLQDHHAGAAAGLSAFRRVAEGHSDEHVRTAVARLAEEVEQDKAALEEIMSSLEASPSTLKDLTGKIGEKAGRLKPNERLASRSPLSDVVELEGLVLGVHGKALLWEALLLCGDPRLDLARVNALFESAKAQETELRELRKSQLTKLREE